MSTTGMTEDERAKWLQLPITTFQAMKLKNDLCSLERHYQAQNQHELASMCQSALHYMFLVERAENKILQKDKLRLWASVHNQLSFCPTKRLDAQTAK
jgi:hypothetical protein